MQASLDLGAVYETVDVESVHGLSGWASCPVTSWAKTEKKEINKSQNQPGIHDIYYVLDNIYSDTLTSSIACITIGLVVPFLESGI